MKKTVKVEDIIALARQDVIMYNNLMNDGKYELARILRAGIDSYFSIIMVLAVGYCKDFDDKAEEIRREIWGE